MSAPTFQFDIITLQGKAYSGEVESLVLPGAVGSFGVLANHASLISNCAAGKLKIREKADREIRYETGKGFFEVVKNRAILLASSAKASTA